MNNTASLLLLFVAAGLLVVLGVGLGRERGRQPSARDTALMAGMTGITVGFLVMFLSASPLTLGPISIGVTLVGVWWRRNQIGPIGAFLVGGGLLVAVMQIYQLLNDLGDPAVTIPGWTPVPLALGIALAILGTSLVAAAALDDGEVS